MLPPVRWLTGIVAEFGMFVKGVLQYRQEPVDLAVILVACGFAYGYSRQVIAQDVFGIEALILAVRSRCERPCLRSRAA